MAVFSYKAKDSKGQVIAGLLEAETVNAVISRLQAMGYFPVSVENESEKKRRVAAVAKRLARRVSVNDLATFNRQLADLLSSGIPLVRALGVIQNQTANETFVEIIGQIAQDVAGGDSLAGAMAKHPKVFSKLYVAMVRSGEAGGMLDVVLSRLADFAETEAEVRAKIKAALAYPVVMVFAGIGAVTILMTVVMPKILKIYSELNQTLPWPTQALIAVSDFLRSYWVFIFAGVAGGGVALWRLIKTPEGKRAVDRLIVKIPLLGPTIVKREIANFARTFGSLLHNGVSILPALEIVHEVLTNTVVADEVAKIPEHVTQGEGVAGPLKKSKVFPPVVVNMIAIGEETGRLDDVLLKVARSYELEVERSVKTLTSLIEPLIILAMGVVVGFIVIAMLLPIFSIDPSQQG
ncbi:MAG: type II secretion system inner membrane protein GspF [Candidatus Sumerlaeaceae bacterium]|nr:type II secretion system inner membrane protein GspF [Candidatus Sumerlaeaceae bacterium]